MKGGILIVRPNGDIEQRELSQPPSGQELHDIVDGYIEVVPSWYNVRIDDTVMRCVAFCDEDGKNTGKQLNEKATQMWDEALQRHGNALLWRDHLVGDIAIVWGDNALLAAL
jgi:hypothetical protein